MYYLICLVIISSTNVLPRVGFTSIGRLNLGGTYFLSEDFLLDSRILYCFLLMDTSVDE